MGAADAITIFANDTTFACMRKQLFKKFSEDVRERNRADESAHNRQGIRDRFVSSVFWGSLYRRAKERCRFRKMRVGDSEEPGRRSEQDKQ